MFFRRGQVPANKTGQAQYLLLQEIVMNLRRRAGFIALLAMMLVGAAVWILAVRNPAEAVVKNNAKFPQHILLIRHAEKTGDKADIHLSEQGQKRAEMLQQLFLVSKDRPDPFPTPDFLFAASNTNGSHRPLETLTPLAPKLKLPIGNAYTSKLPAAPSPIDGQVKTDEVPGMQALRDELFGKSMYFGKTILVAWRHSTIPQLAKTLNAREAPTKWEDDVFDRVWQINYDDHGVATFLDRPQRLLPGDREK
jgi:hypothetical protein